MHLLKTQTLCSTLNKWVSNFIKIPREYIELGPHTAAVLPEETGGTMSCWSQSKIKVPRSEVELATVLACGQSFRWKSDNEDKNSNNLEWIGVFGHHLWVLSQTDTEIRYKVYGSKKLQAYDKLLHDYFQLDISLAKLYKQWSSKDSKFASLTEVDYRGIRMLQQDPVENTFSFICSSNNNISRISQMVEKMCLYYGEEITELNGKVYYDFPTLDALCQDGVEKKFREESFGYRAAYIAKSAKKIVENGGHEWIQNLRNLEYVDARKELQTLTGIGRKVADCICLMSLGFAQAIPVDTHIHQVAKEYLPHIAKAKTLTDKIYSEIVDYFVSIYGPYAGWAHSVLFASTLKHLKSEPNSKSKKAKEKIIKITNEVTNHSNNGIIVAQVKTKVATSKRTALASETKKSKVKSKKVN